MPRRILLADLVAEALWTDRVDEVEEAFKARREGALTALDEAYRRAHGRLRVPEKRADEFVPGWLLDVINVGVSPDQGHSPWFVSRAMLYSHRVAVADPLQPYLEAPLTVTDSICGSLKLVLLYAALERAGIVFYLPYQSEARRGFVEDATSQQLTNDDLEDYFRRFLAPTNQYIHISDEEWQQATGPAWLARNAAQLELSVGLAGVRDLLTWQARYRDSVDLYVSDFSMYRDAFTWLMEREPLGLLTNERSPDAPALRGLLTLPVLQAEALAGLTVRDLIDIREERIFLDWRESLSTGLGLASATAGGDAQRAFADQMLSERERLLRRARSFNWLRDLPEKGAAFGITSSAPLPRPDSPGPPSATSLGMMRPLRPHQRWA